MRTRVKRTYTVQVPKLPGYIPPPHTPLKR